MVRNKIDILPAWAPKTRPTVIDHRDEREADKHGCPHEWFLIT